MKHNHPRWRTQLKKKIQRAVNQGRHLSNLWFNQVKQQLPQHQLSLLLSFPIRNILLGSLMGWIIITPGQLCEEAVRPAQTLKGAAVCQEKQRMSLTNGNSHKSSCLSEQLSKKNTKSNCIPDTVSWLCNTARSRRANISKRKSVLTETATNKFITIHYIWENMKVDFSSRVRSNVHLCAASRFLLWLRHENGNESPAVWHIPETKARTQENGIK